MKELSTNIKIQRILLIIILIAISFVCFSIMNNKYDRLARYEYADPTNSDIIEERLTDAEIDFLIQQKIKPDQFLPYIDIEGFNVKNTLYYEACNDLQPTTLESIVSFSNQYRETIDYLDFVNYITYYTYNQLEEFYNGAYTYVENVSLINDPTKHVYDIAGNKTLYKYTPANLVEITNLIMPSASSIPNEKIMVHVDVIEPLSNMLAAMEQEFEHTAGGLIATTGYISYASQIPLYEAALVSFGADGFNKYEDYPGQNPAQYGYMIEFTIAGLDPTTISENEQVLWLKRNACAYGFELPYSSENTINNDKVEQPLTILYTGIIEEPKAEDVQDTDSEEDNSES